jgi:hypothetical protein
MSDVGSDVGTGNTNIGLHLEKFYEGISEQNMGLLVYEPQDLHPGNKVGYNDITATRLPPIEGKVCTPCSWRGVSDTLPDKLSAHPFSW